MTIRFKAHCGNDVWDVELSQPSGGGGSFHIVIDNYYCGQIVKTSEGWRGYPNTKSRLTWADMLVFIEMIEQEENEHRT
jgi:hypothetical protein